MASIKPYRGDQWRAQICKDGSRRSKVFGSQEDAEAWAARAERVFSKGVVFGAPRTVLRAQMSAPYQREEILAAAVHHPDPSGIYFLIRDGNIVYVGQSVNVLWRIAKHRYEGRKFDSYAVVGCSPEQLDDLERVYIRALVPEDNMSFGNRDFTKRPPSRQRGADE